MSDTKIKIIKSPIAPVREADYWDEYANQPLYNVRLSNGMIISTPDDFFEEIESGTQQENEEEIEKS